AATSFPAGSLARGVLAGLALGAFAPIAWLADKVAGNRDASTFPPNLTRVVLGLAVVRQGGAALHWAKRGGSGRNHAHTETTQSPFARANDLIRRQNLVAAETRSGRRKRGGWARCDLAKKGDVTAKNV